MYDLKDSMPFETEEDDFDTIMASDLSFSGNIRCAKPFMIKGKMGGNIEATSDLLVDLDADVNADIISELLDLQGRRVSHPTRGIYILNGTKVMVSY